ncbi:PREDICTED: squamosa promoter-binding-like protein 7 [Nelumbo nucifera]|uniref:Squamosa promoter-binding-like protein 7 n=1 Tax=Nelumbo nucifera TaxID=4432 RepID=A0A1U8BQ89_NELNU|nr:PREDICTED: squamosa promoter-binding-like protein 7 [Nelumbo nucifera]
MEIPHPPPSDQAVSLTRVRAPEMEFPQILDEASAPWEWGNLLDFTVDDQLVVSWDSDNNPTIAQAPELVPQPFSNRGTDASDRVRKRDPRLTCSNFLAGRIPCACPEIDEKDEGEAAVGKKRARTAPVGTARCQVPGCEVDISELKGYHRRHRVCLRCANATSVVLDGQSKRYCQQCGKFHILSDFDEGKRSCRRKLERHNKRRRRKAVDSRGAVEKEGQGSLSPEDTSGDAEAGKDTLCLNDRVPQREVTLEPEDGHVSPPCSAPSSQNVQSDSVVSFAASGETPMDGRKENSKNAISSPFCDNKSAYSSVCPTGRVSFKLYDWNPAEFPRRLRHQIFQWLASMPVELEGYIRPGCTILTVFIAMPQVMWDKLSQDAASYIHGFVTSPENILWRKGVMRVYLCNMIFQVLKDGMSLVNIKMEVRAPRLHYIHPTCFEAGKPMEFVACGSNLQQPKFRFLVSFCGKYLSYDYCLAISPTQNVSDDTHSCDHQMYKIYIPHTDPKLFGPAFVEVENESGISNYIPILIANREICSEMQVLQHKLDGSFCAERPQLAIAGSLSDECEVLVLRQTAVSELLLDIAWLLKESELGSIQSLSTSTQIQRFNSLLDFLIKNNLTMVLMKILEAMKVVDKELNNTVNATDDAGVRLFHKYMDHASEIVCKKIQNIQDLPKYSGRDSYSKSFDKNDMISGMPNNQDISRTGGVEIFGAVATSNSGDSSVNVPLINRDVVMNVNYEPRKSCGYILSNTTRNSRPLVFIVVATAMCFGICAVLLHPHKVGDLAISIRRCLFGNPKPYKLT